MILIADVRLAVFSHKLNTYYIRLQDFAEGDFIVACIPEIPNSGFFEVTILFIEHADFGKNNPCRMYQQIRYDDPLILTRSQDGP